MPTKIQKSACVEKTSYIESICQHKKVLHVGCTNYPNTKSRLLNGKLLHQHLLETAREVHGIDIDSDGLNFLRENGFTNIFELDAVELQKKNEFLSDTYDMVILADIIEHVPDPKSVILGAISRINHNGEILISVPNAFYWFGFLCAMLGYEATHPEHVSTYSQLNLKRLFSQLDLQMVEIRNYHESSYTKDSRKIASVAKWFERVVLLKIFPTISCGIICRVTLKK